MILLLCYTTYVCYCVAMSRKGIPNRSVRSLQDRFEEKFVLPGEDDGCWEWQATKNARGYGMIRESRGRLMLCAHRVAFELYVGSIPEGGIVRHKCDNPSCVNPDHLEMGSQSDNMNDWWQRGVNARRKITKEQAAEIRQRYSVGNVYQVDLAEEFGISQSMVSAIVRGVRH